MGPDHSEGLGKRQIGFRPLSALVPVIVLGFHRVDELGCVLCKLGVVEVWKRWRWFSTWTGKES